MRRGANSSAGQTTEPRTSFCPHTGSSARRSQKESASGDSDSQSPCRPTTTAGTPTVPMPGRPAERRATTTPLTPLGTTPATAVEMPSADTSGGKRKFMPSASALGQRTTDGVDASTRQATAPRERKRGELLGPSEWNRPSVRVSMLALASFMSTFSPAETTVAEQGERARTQSATPSKSAQSTHSDADAALAATCFARSAKMSLHSFVIALSDVTDSCEKRVRKVPDMLRAAGLDPRALLRIDNDAEDDDRDRARDGLNREPSTREGSVRVIVTAPLSVVDMASPASDASTFRLAMRPSVSESVSSGDGSKWSRSSSPHVSAADAHADILISRENAFDAAATDSTSACIDPCGGVTRTPCTITPLSRRSPDLSPIASASIAEG
eukprot:Opistho-2@82517